MASSISWKTAVLGQSEEHLQCLQGHVFVHSDLIEPLEGLCAAAQKAGFHLSVASGFRSFERQLQIWNDKLGGRRPVVDASGQTVDLSSLKPLEQVETLMRWSALPGTSRHHWGTDLDIYDLSAIDEDYQLRLLPEEYAFNGSFGPLIVWLRSFLEASDSRFFFPYREDSGGVMPEPWHISYQPLAHEFSKHWSQQSWLDTLKRVDITKKGVILNNADYLYERFIQPSIIPCDTYTY